MEDRTSLEETAQHEPLHKTLKSSLLKEVDVTIYKQFIFNYLLRHQSTETSHHFVLEKIMKGKKKKKEKKRVALILKCLSFF